MYAYIPKPTRIAWSHIKSLLIHYSYEKINNTSNKKSSPSSVYYPILSPRWLDSSPTEYVILHARYLPVQNYTVWKRLDTAYRPHEPIQNSG